MIKYGLILCSLVLFFSCKKDPSVLLLIQPINNSTTNDAILPLAVGNYWIYQKSNDDSTGTYTMQPQFDSVYVEKDSMIFGIHYYKLGHANLNFVYYFNISDTCWIRDSLGYLINYPSKILLDTIHILDTISGISYGAGYYGKMVPDVFTNKTFQIGTYSGFWMRQCFLYPMNLNHYNGTYCYQAFVKNIGLIRARMLFTGNPYHTMFSQHLIRYHLN